MYTELFIRYKVPLMLASVGIFCLMLFTISVFSSSSEFEETESDIKLIENTSESAEPEKIVVDIQGGVNRPGVYEMQSGERVVDLIDQAGGYRSDADMEWVSQQVNQAQLLQDGTKLYIVLIGDDRSEAAHDSDKSSGMININGASISELEELDGIGEKRAQNIIEGRPYQAVEELREKGIVGEKTFEAIQGKISVY